MLTTSVCIPAYNSAERIGNALKSLVEQSLPPSEVIVCDDCSSDNTLEVVRSFSHQLPLKIFRNEQNLGMIRNWNACLEHAQGDLVAFLHDDDAYRPGFISEAVKVFEQDDRIGLWACSMPVDRVAGIRNMEGLVKPEDYAQLVFSVRWVPPPTVVVFRRQALGCAGHYSETYKYMAEPDLYLRIFACGFYGFNTKQVLVDRGSPETRVTNKVWLTPLNIKERVYFIQHWAGHQLLGNWQTPALEAFNSIQAIAARALGNNLLHLRLKHMWEISSILLTAQLALEKSGVKGDAGRRYRLFTRTLAALPGETKDMLLRSWVWRLLRQAKNWDRRTHKFLFPKPSTAFLRTGENFGKQLERALSNPTDIERKQLRKLFEETSLAVFWTYYVAGKAAPHYHIPWEGREMTKLPMDVLVYKDLIESSRPDVLIEIGTQRGTSALFFASILKPLGGKVITLDLVSPPPDVLEEFRRLDIEFIKGDATADEVAQKVEELVEGKRCMVVDDGSHEYDDVLNAFLLYSKHVPLGGFYVVEDGFTNWLITKSSHNALGAVDDILEGRRQFVRDSRYDRFIFFSAFQGIMRRVAVD